uniref:Cytidyltransferase-like domain-containing protein n=1 Tax=Trieres chinensis TaxID=1514140 RepID=A0A7S1ZCW2_TRICV|mmetsp:Transcript_22834/g.46365  ORF Transcript_22834/g.46365 Transcript_22834/m.46365 type:complete len:229 (+) Transcript_22834:248-934(+)
MGNVQGCDLAFGGALVVVAAVVFSVHRLFFTVLIRYPWSGLVVAEEQKVRDKSEKVMFAGSLNPPHHGHIAMITYLAERYGEVVVVIGINPKKNYKVSPARRKKLLEDMITGSKIKGKVQVEVVAGYIWRFALRENVSIMFRGIRSWKRDGSDERLLFLQNTWGPILLGPLKWPLPQHFLEGKPEYNHISSTLIRDMCLEAKKEGKKPNLNALVPKSTADDVAKLYSS